jgi:hypothetical protein
MGLRAPWLFLGSATLVVACGLSVGGSAPEPGPSVTGGLDATDQGEGSLPADSPPEASHDDGHAGPGKDAGAHDAPVTADVVTDAPLDRAVDVEVDDGGSADASDAPTDVLPDGTACPDGSPGCVIVPAGWTLVAFSTGQSAACPVGFQSPADLVEGPDAAGACSCGTCTVTQQASCASGTVSVYYDTASSRPGTCALPGSVTPLGNSPAGACATDVYKGSYNTYDIEYVPPPATGGACTSAGTQSGSVTYAAHDRACAPVSAASAGCVGDACTPSLGGGYLACIMQAGQAACPAGPLGVQHTVGSGTSLTCSDCGCSATAQCTGTVTLYSDTGCTKNALAVPADSTCYSIKTLNGGSNYNSAVAAYTYTAITPTTQCSPTGTSSATTTLTGVSTICCAQ